MQDIDPNRQKKFLADMNVIAQLMHPAVNRLYGVAQKGSKFALVYPWMGQSMVDIVTSQTFGWKYRLLVARDLAEGLATVHGAVPPITHGAVCLDLCTRCGTQCEVDRLWPVTCSSPDGESVRMGGSDNKGDGLASQPRSYRVPGQPLLKRHQVGGVSQSPDGLFAQQEREPTRGRPAVRGKGIYGGRSGQRVEEQGT